MSSAFALWHLVLAADQWFVYDEFDYFLAGDEPLILWLLRPHNEHTIAVTKAWFGALFPVVGLRAYDLYLAPLVIAHIVVFGAIYRLVSRATASEVVAIGSAFIAAAMGAAAGTLTWAGQLQYVGAAAAGMLAVILAVEPPVRARILALGAVTLFGTMSGSAFVPLALACSAAFGAQRRWAEAALISAVPIGWQLLVRVVWAPDLIYAPGGVDEIIRAAPAFAFSVLGAAISQTVHNPYLSGPLLVALVAGTLAFLSSGGDGGRARLTVMTLVVATVLSMTALIGGRLGRGTEVAASGHYSYLFLITLLPLSAILVGRFARRRSVLVATAAAMATLAMWGQMKLADDAAGLSAWKQQGRAVMEASAALLASGAPTFPDQIPAPGTAPTVDIETLRSWVVAGSIDATSHDPMLADQASLYTQWRLVPSVPVTGDCPAVSEGEQVAIPPSPALSLTGGSTDASVTVRYLGSRVIRQFIVGPGSSRLESVASRSAMLSVSASEVVVCVAELPQARR